MRLVQIALSLSFVASILCHSARAAEANSTNAALKRVADAYLTKKPAPALSTGVTYQAALELQKEYVSLIQKQLGERAGYKVGIVTKAGQERLGIDHPIRGVLFKKMLLTNNVQVATNYGTRPILEPDLLVRVKDEKINDARTPQEIMQHLSEVICFIELADGTFATNAPVDASVLTASNVGARAGVLGQSRKVDAQKSFYDAWSQMSLVLKDGAGKELSRTKADGVMGHPVHAVLWLVQDLKKAGEKLKAGDVISLGSPSPQVMPKKGDKYVLTYEGLPGGPLTATVSFK
ncbi:MAG TPA: hypothetical protein VF773_09785 [Verrucomicrobiae bacterium]